MEDALVPRDEFLELHFRLKTWWGMGMLSHNAYSVGMHVLQKMIRCDSLEVVATWQEFCLEVVMLKGDIVAPPASDKRYDHLGALQELHNTLGLLSHVTQEGMDLDLKELAEMSGPLILHHFTQAPEADSFLIRGPTPMLWVFRKEAGYSIPDTWTEFKGTSKKTTLPPWLAGSQKLKV